MTTDSTNASPDGLPPEDDGPVIPECVADLPDLSLFPVRVVFDRSPLQPLTLYPTGGHITVQGYLSQTISDFKNGAKKAQSAKGMRIMHGVADAVSEALFAGKYWVDARVKIGWITVFIDSTVINVAKIHEELEKATRAPSLADIDMQRLTEMHAEYLRKLQRSLK